MELGIYSFGDNSRDPETGKFFEPATLYRNLIERVELADQVGLSYFGLGEHHREDYPVSSPSTVLSYASARTQNIRLGSAVTVLPTKDPVRLFEQYATLDVLSGGRAEMTVGTGAYLESYPLFGTDHDGRHEHFEERLELLLQLQRDNPITWTGKSRAPLDDAGVWPRPIQPELPLWVAAGSSLESSERAGRYGVNVMYSFLRSGPCEHQDLVEHYRATIAEHASANATQVGIAGRGLIGTDSRATKELFYSHWNESMQQTSRERSTKAPSRADYDALSVESGPIMAGSVSETVERLGQMFTTLKNDRYIMHMDVGNVPHADVMRSIEAFGTEVMPQLAELKN
ncbi:MAG: hypothetical protein RLZZ600_609 [Actinomycetota bacterium]